MTVAQKGQHKFKRKLEQRLHKQQKKEHQIISTSVVTSPAFKSKASDKKAYKSFQSANSKSQKTKGSC